MDIGLMNVKGDLRLKTIAGNTWYVGPNCTYTTIDAALSACSAGDTVLVCPGTYTEVITFDVDNCTLRAIGSAEDTIITQATAMAVSFGTSSGCTLSGFTVSVTAANGNDDYAVYSNNDSAIDYNIIENCIITWAASIALTDTEAISIADGNCIIRNNRITATNTYASTSASQLDGINTNQNGHTNYIYNNIVTVTTNDTDGAGNVDNGIYLCYTTNATTNYVFNNTITITAVGATTNDETNGIRCGAGGATAKNYIVGNIITSIATSSGTAHGIRTVDVSYIIGNFINCTTGDTDGNWLKATAGTCYACGNIAIGDCNYTAGGTNYIENNFVKTDAVWGGGDDPATSLVDRFAAGFCVGADVLNSVIDDASHGTGVTAIYIGNKAITATFTGCHYYQIQDKDLERGELVRLNADKKIERVTGAKDRNAIGIFWGITDDKDSFGNKYDEPVTCAVAAIGDSYDEHDKQPLQGAWVSVRNGSIKEGDYLCSSSIAGYLEKQDDNICHSYTKGKAMQIITEDTKNAYIYLL